MIIKEYILKSGYPIPSIGLGTWQITGPELRNAIEYAISMGYKHIDTADAYGNHEEVGLAIAQSNINREKIFLTTKVWHDKLDAQGVKTSVERFLRELKMDYIDLLLIHWPNSRIPISETLAAMGREKEKERIRSIGVSNFTIDHLKEALKCGVDIEVNQVEFHPSFNQGDLKAFCDRFGIRAVAYSPLAQGRDFEHEVIRELSRNYRRTEAQIIINWIISKGMVAIPRSSNTEHILDNYMALEFELSDQDIKDIDDRVTVQERMLDPQWAEF